MIPDWMVEYWVMQGYFLENPEGKLAVVGQKSQLVKVMQTAYKKSNQVSWSVIELSEKLGLDYAKEADAALIDLILSQLSHPDKSFGYEFAWVKLDLLNGTLELTQYAKEKMA